MEFFFFFLCVFNMSSNDVSPQVKTVLRTDITSANVAILIYKSKVIPVTGLGGLWGCEMLRIPHCLDNRLTDGGKVVSPTQQPHFTPQNIIILTFQHIY
jgi:hypothetical protein